MDILRPMIPFLLPLIALELVLVVFALRDLIRRPRTNGPKWLWALVIVLIQIIGPIIYFVVGRRED